MEEFFAELDAARSSEALVQKIADMILATPGTARAAEQAEAASVTLIFSEKMMMSFFDTFSCQFWHSRMKTES
jgi:hypothetical protein